MAPILTMVAALASPPNSETEIYYRAKLRPLTQADKDTSS